MTLLYGIDVGWTSTSTLLLMSDESPLSSGSLSLWQVSWIGSILCVGGAVGQMVFGYLADAFGRKMGLGLAFVPSVVSNFCSYYSDIFVLNDDFFYYFYIDKLVTNRIRTRFFQYFYLTNPQWFRRRCSVSNCPTFRE